MATVSTPSECVSSSPFGHSALAVSPPPEPPEASVDSAAVEPEEVESLEPPQPASAATRAASSIRVAVSFFIGTGGVPRGEAGILG